MATTTLLSTVTETVTIRLTSPTTTRMPLDYGDVVYLMSVSSLEILGRLLLYILGFGAATLLGFGVYRLGAFRPSNIEATVLFPALVYTVVLALLTLTNIFPYPYWFCVVIALLFTLWMAVTLMVAYFLIYMVLNLCGAAARRWILDVEPAKPEAEVGNTGELKPLLQTHLNGGDGVNANGQRNEDTKK